MTQLNPTMQIGADNPAEHQAENQTHQLDLIDTLLKLNPAGSTYRARHFRDNICHSTQASYDALFSNKLHLPLQTRWLVALYAAQLTQSHELTRHYLNEAEDAGVTEEALQAVLQDDLDLISEPTLRAILHFTRTLTLKPIEGDQSALLDLESAGVATADCIALAQLIAFLSYQIRLVTGLKAMQALEDTQ
ncbi:hypothetical protein GCM10007162_15610 [Ignatzschineria ureiclastica]|nr:carboxymuconolactone decarboxylase family protein [Ignatzschineria ureiclastica]GHA00224.1 hypothetical protein GCM10007162_15610 [Ignatzschineria ureiclastica]